LGDLDDVAIRERKVHWLAGVSEVLPQVLRNHADLLLQCPHNLLFCRGREAISALAQEQLQIVCDIPVFFVFCFVWVSTLEESHNRKQNKGKRSTFRRRQSF